MGLALLFGILVLVLGASIVLHVLFDVHVPVFRTAVGLAFVYLGVRVLAGAWMPQRTSHDGNEAVFSVTRFAPTDASMLSRKYSIVFGRGIVDLSGIGATEQEQLVQVDVVFGDAEIEIDPATPIDIRGNAVFGEVRMPDRSTANFGEVRYRGGAPGAPRIELVVNAVFGTARVVRRQAAPERPGAPIAVQRAETPSTY